MIKERGRQRVEEVGNHIIFETDSVAEKGSVKSSMHMMRAITPKFKGGKFEYDADYNKLNRWKEKNDLQNDDMCELFRVREDFDTESQKPLQFSVQEEETDQFEVQRPRVFSQSNLSIVSPFR